MIKLIDAGDKTAIILSFLCALHCTVLPIVLILLPSISGLLAFDPEALHLWLIFAVIPISLYAVISGYRYHSNKNILAISVIGMILLVAAVIFGHDILNGKGEVILTLAGSLLVMLGHLRNFKLRRNKTCKKSIA